MDILFQDEHYLAVHKPAGLFVHRTKLANERDCAQQRLGDLVKRRLFPVHRLDRPTSGVLIFATNREAARRLCGLFEDRGVGKTYLAVVRGYPEERGVIDRPLRQARDKEPRPAVTRYRRLAQTELDIPIGPHATARFSLVEASPETGRMHQIRRHFNRLNHPIVGDTTHGDRAWNRLFRDHFQLNRLLLVAMSLVFVHPFTEEKLVIRGSLDPELVAFFQLLHWPLPGQETGEP